MPDEATPERVAAIADGLAAVRSRIDAACRAARRTNDEVRLIVVTKTYPASEVVALARLGVTDVGENRDQEAAPKRVAAEAAGAVPGAGERLAWHCIGQVQTNKARSVATWADAVHSIDRPRLVEALGRAVAEVGRPLDALVQVSLDAEVGRGGCRPKDVTALADLVAATDGLTLRGVMAVAPLGVDPDAAFGELQTVSARLLAAHPEASWISAGMSGDLEQAIAHGATHVRVGSAVLGSRPAVR